MKRLEGPGATARSRRPARRQRRSLKHWFANDGAEVQPCCEVTNSWGRAVARTMRWGERDVESNLVRGRLDPGMSHNDQAMDQARAAAVALAEELGERLWGVVLFGSAARGEATSNSDLDLLVVADALPERLGDRMRLIMQSLPGHLRGRASVIARTRREFEDAFPSLYLDIGLDGVVLCDRDGYTRQQLERIRALTREAGLSRAPTRGGFEWRWTTPPTGHWRVDWDGVRGLRA